MTRNTFLATRTMFIVNIHMFNKFPCGHVSGHQEHVSGDKKRAACTFLATRNGIVRDYIHVSRYNKKPHVFICMFMRGVVTTNELLVPRNVYYFRFWSRETCFW